MTVGAALGIWVAARHRAHTHALARPCFAHEQAGACVGHAIGAAVTPYIAAGFAGAAIGLVVAVLLKVLRRSVSGARPPGLRRRGRVRRARPAQRGGPRAARRGSSLITAARDVPPATTAPAVELSTTELHAMRLKVRRSVLAAMRELNGGGDRQQILARARAIGGFTARELRAPTPARHRKKHQHQIDHDLDWVLTDLKRDGLATNPRRGIWQLTDAALVQTEAPLADEASASRLDELRAMPYDDYLRTPEWRHTRAAALVRADHQCAMNATHTGPLEVHHRSYERRGAERPSDLIVLCRTCHQVHHAHNNNSGA